MIPIILSVSIGPFGWGDTFVPSSVDAVMLDDYDSCALTSLFVVCKLRGVQVDWDNLKKLLGPHAPDGSHSFADIARAAEALRMHPIGIKAWRKRLGHLPMPAIVQVHDPKEPHKTPHLLVLLNQGPDGVTLLDPPYPHFFLPEARFTYTWTGNIMVFAQNETEAPAICSGIGNRGPLLRLYWLLASCLILAAVGGTWRSWTRVFNRLIAATLLATWQSMRLRYTVCFILMAAGLAAVLYPQLLKENAFPPVCKLQKPAFELGELSPGPVDYTITVSNGGTKPLLIRSMTSSCACAIVSGPQMIGPGQGQPVKVRISVSPGLGSARLTIESNDPQGPKNVLLSWHGRANPRVCPYKIVGAELPAGIPYQQTVRLIYPGGKSALMPVILGCDCDSPRVHLVPGNDNPQAKRFAHAGFLTQILGEHELTLKVAPPPGGGSIESKCRIRLKYGASESSLNLPIALTFQCQDFTTDVTSVSFSADSRNELIGSKRTVHITPGKEGRRFFIANAPPWLECHLLQGEGSQCTLEISIKKPPSHPLDFATLNMCQVGRKLPGAALRVSAFYPPP